MRDGIKKASFRIKGIFQSHSEGGIMKLKTSNGDMNMKGVDFLRIGDLESVIKEAEDDLKRKVADTRKEERERLVPRIHEAEARAQKCIEFIENMKKDIEKDLDEKRIIIETFLNEVK